MSQESVTILTRKRADMTSLLSGIHTREAKLGDRRQSSLEILEIEVMSNMEDLPNRMKFVLPHAKKNITADLSTIST